MILALVRHGQTDYNLKRLVQGRIDNPLNEQGLKQAKSAAQFIKKMDFSFDFIASSPLSRALQTAFVISKKINYSKEIYVSPYLVERDFSPFDGEDVDRTFALIADPNFSHPLYEDNESLIDRVTYGLKQIKNRFKDQNGLIVAHSHVIKAILNYIDPIKFDFLNHYIQNGEVNVIEITEDGYQYLYKSSF